MADQRAGKRTVRTHVLKAKPAPRSQRASLPSALGNESFAGYWQDVAHECAEARELGAGAAKPNAQAALLIHMVQRFPDTVRRLAEF